MATINIGGRKVGPDQPCYIIAEAGVNHNGDLEMARRLIDVAKEAGADAVKFQTFRTELVTTNFPADSADEESQFDLLKRLELTADDFSKLKEYCVEREITFISTPFEEESADLLESLGVPVYKLPSGEITNLPLLQHIARKGLPMIVSTGMSTLEEVRSAVETIQGAGNQDFVLLHCVSVYPAPPEDVNLRAMLTLASEFEKLVGFSDHTLGTEISAAAVAMGACVIEKHFTLDRSLPGPDHCASLEPHELSALVETIRNVEAALGHGRKEPTDSEAETALMARKSLVAAGDIPRGTMLTRDLVTMKNPGTGLTPDKLDELIGLTTLSDIPADTLFTWDMVQ